MKSAKQKIAPHIHWADFSLYIVVIWQVIGDDVTQTLKLWYK